MGAHPDQYQEFRLDRAMPVGRVVGLLARGRIGIGEQREKRGRLQGVERLLGAVDDEYRPRGPQHDDLLAGLELADVDLDRSGGRLRLRVGVHLVDSGHSAPPRRPRRPPRWRCRGSRGASARPRRGQANASKPWSCCASIRRTASAAAIEWLNKQCGGIRAAGRTGGETVRRFSAGSRRQTVAQKPGSAISRDNHVAMLRESYYVHV